MVVSKHPENCTKHSETVLEAHEIIGDRSRASPSQALESGLCYTSSPPDVRGSRQVHSLFQEDAVLYNSNNGLLGAGHRTDGNAAPDVLHRNHEKS